LYANFFQSSEQVSAISAMNNIDIPYTQTSIQAYIEESLTAHYFVDSFFTLAASKNRTIDYYNDYLPMITTSNLVTSVINNIVWCNIVPNASKDAFITKVRSLGKDFATFDIFGRDAANNPIPAPPADIYYVYVMIGPYSKKNSTGYDAGSDPPRLLALHNTVATKQIVSTTPITLASLGGQVPGINTFRLCSDNTTFTSVSYRIDYLLTNGITSKSLSDFIIQAYDSSYNATSKGFLFSTQSTESPNMTDQQHVAVMESAPWIGRFDISVADHTWNIVLIPTSSYLSKFVDNSKWVIVVGILIAWVLIIGIVIISAKCLQYQHKARKMEVKRIAILDDYAVKTNEMLERLSQQNSRILTTVNTIPYPICVVNAKGIIVTTNSSFNQQLGYTDMDLNDVSISRILPSLDPLFFMSNEETITTTAMSLFKIPINTEISARALDASRFDELLDDREFVIVIRPLIEKEKLEEKNKKQKEVLDKKLQIAQFDSHFRRKEFRRNFIRFCRKHKNDENVKFLEAVLKYKKSPFERKIVMQKQIFDQYLCIGSENQLNISADMSMRMEAKLEKSFGDDDVFEMVEELIKSMIVVDSYPLFLKAVE
jgi:PAS domain-containing protein